MLRMSLVGIGTGLWVSGRVQSTTKYVHACNNGQRSVET